jgi:hypothetical protein
MLKSFVLTVFFGLAVASTFSCKKDDCAIEENNAFSCLLELTVDSLAGFDTVVHPDSGVLHLPLAFNVSGSCYWIGDLRPEGSRFTVSNYVYDTDARSIRGLGTLTYTDQNGDALVFYGDYFRYANQSSRWYLIFDTGTGPWKKAAGWNFGGSIDNGTPPGVETVSTWCGLTVY